MNGNKLLIGIGLIIMLSCSNNEPEITVENAAEKFCNCKSLEPTKEEGFSEEFAECNKEFYAFFGDLVQDDIASQKIDSLVQLSCQND